MIAAVVRDLCGKLSQRCRGGLASEAKRPLWYRQIIWLHVPGKAWCCNNFSACRLRMSTSVDSQGVSRYPRWTWWLSCSGGKVSTGMQKTPWLISNLCRDSRNGRIIWLLIQIYPDHMIRCIHMPSSSVADSIWMKHNSHQFTKLSSEWSREVMSCHDIRPGLACLFLRPRNQVPNVPAATPEGKSCTGKQVWFPLTWRRVYGGNEKNKSILPKILSNELLCTIVVADSASKLLPICTSIKFLSWQFCVWFVSHWKWWLERELFLYSKKGNLSNCCTQFDSKVVTAPARHRIPFKTPKVSIARSMYIENMRKTK